MEDYKFLIETKEITKGKPEQVRLGLKKLTVYFNGKEYFVFDSYCPHARADLTKAKYSEREVQCHWHGYRFSLENGRGKGNNFQLKLYKVKIEDGKVFVKEKKEEEQESLLFFPEVKFKGEKDDK